MLTGFNAALKEGLTGRFGEKEMGFVGMDLNLRLPVNCKLTIFSEEAPLPAGAWDNEPFWRQRLNATRLSHENGKRFYFFFLFPSLKKKHF